MTIDTAKVAWNYTNIQEIRKYNITVCSWGGSEFIKPVKCIDMFGNEVSMASRKPKLIILENGETRNEY